MKGKIVSYGLSAIVLLSVLAMTIPASADIQMADEFGVEDAMGNPGDYVNVLVNITNVKNGPIVAIEFELIYDKSVLELTNVQRSELTTNWSEPERKGEYGIGIVGSPSVAIQNGASGSVVNLTFHVIGTGSTGMNLSNIILYNYSNGMMQQGTAPPKNGTFTVIGIDKTAPTTNVTAPPTLWPGKPNETTIPSGTILPWTNGTVKLWFFRTDNGGSGVAYTNLSLAAESETDTLNVTISNNSWAMNRTLKKGENVTVPFNEIFGEYFNVTISEECNATIEYYSVDNADNSETPKTVTVRIRSLPDTIPPTTEVTTTPPEPTTGWWNTTVMLSFHRYDNGGANITGVNYTAYKMTGANATPWTIVPGEEDFTVNITAEGVTTVYYRSEDKAGNRESIKSMSVSIDKTSPDIISVKLDKTEVYPGENINVTVKVTDALSGISTVTAEGVPLTYSPEQDIWYGTIAAAPTPGTYNVTVEVIDLAWNIAVNDTVQYEVREPPRLAKIVVPPELTLNVNETKEIVAIAYDQYNETMEGIVINWFIYGSKIGDVYPTTSMTDEKGVAKTNFTALKEGITAVVAVNRTINRTIYNATIVTVKEVPPKKNFSVRIEPSMIWVNVSATVLVDVRDAETNMPVEGATVDLSGCGYANETTTNASGIATFEVNATSTGYITVTVSKDEYNTYENPNAIVVHWNWYISPDSDGGSKVIDAEIQEAVYCWLTDTPMPMTGVKITDERMQEIVYLWLTG